ncbi:hypothetical protein TanjilG_08609 [Lupinus angustifolius]|uniref:Uncharacterized protein n=1 Tax=Lupinus angustifolius TaxID=3871 RepID=A0A4P1RPN3_LUPAN|nr:hypothetical protein TanjilG_08609 [Lupinus angustifolius]
MHQRHTNLAENSASATHQRCTNLTENSASATHQRRTNLTENSVSSTHHRRTNLTEQGTTEDAPNNMHQGEPLNQVGTPDCQLGPYTPIT